MMTVQACTFFLACAFYLAYLAESDIIGHDLKRFLWVVSLVLWVVPTVALIYEWWRRMFF